MCFGSGASRRRLEGKSGSGRSDPDRVGEERVSPFVEGPPEVGVGVDRLALAVAPFSSVGVERKVPDVVVAGLLPMFDRQRLAVMLAMKRGRHAFDAIRLALVVLREGDLRPVAPQHQDVPPFRTEKAAKAQQFATCPIGCVIAGGHIGVEQLDPHAVVIACVHAFREPAQIAGYYDPADTRVLHEGLVITIEPFLSTRSRVVEETADGWTLVGARGNRSAQFEHTLVITRGDPIVVTLH